MFCNQCGAALQGQPAVCPACGKPVVSVAPPPSGPVRTERERLAGHLRILGIFWIIAGVLALIPGAALSLGAFFIGIVRPGMFHPHPIGLPPFLHSLGPVVLMSLSGLFLVVGVLCLFTGWGLMKVRHWARPLAIVLGVLALLKFPIGTALGLYTLWVLLNGSTAALYDHMSASAG